MIRVVVADDEHDVRLLLRMQLDSLEDVQLVGEARDGEECLQLCRSEDPDVVIMDLLMPRMDGFAAIGTLQSEWPGIGIVAYTAVAGDFVRLEMERLGVELVLKRGDVSDLAGALRRAALMGRAARRTTHERH